MPQLSFGAVLIISLGLCYFLMLIFITIGLFNGSLPNPSGKAPTVRISVIIPARNEKENILYTLQDLAHQNYPSDLFEVIFIDDESQDQTPDIIEEFISRHPRFPARLLKIDSGDSSGSKKRALAQGIAGSSGELLITTDADTRHGKNWICSISGFYKQFQPAMILSPVAFSDKPDFFSRIQDLEFLGLMAVTEGSCNLKRPLMCNGANLAYTRRAYEAAEGFADNQHIPSGDDMFLMMKIRKMFGPDSVMYNHSPESVVTTEGAKTLKDFFSQRTRWVSKSKNYKDPVVLTAAALTYLFNCSLLSGMISGFFYSFWWPVTMSLLGLKMLVEFPMLAGYATFLGKKKILWLFPVVQILNVFYVVIIGLSGFFIPKSWKGRSISRAVF